MGSATGPPMAMEKAQSQLEIINLLPALYGKGLHTSVPCPPELFASIILINHLRSLLKETDSSRKDLRPAALEILNQIVSFSPERWAAEVALAQIRGTIKGATKLSDDGPDVGRDQEPSLSDWLCIATAYQCAVALYCVATLFDADYLKGEYTRIGSSPGSSIRASYLNLLLQCLLEITT